MENTKLTDAKKALKKEVFSDIPKEELLAVSKEELVGFVESQWSALTARIALLAGSLPQSFSVYFTEASMILISLSERP